MDKTETNRELVEHKDSGGSDEYEGQEEQTLDKDVIALKAKIVERLKM